MRACVRACVRACMRVCVCVLYVFLLFLLLSVCLFYLATEKIEQSEPLLCYFHERKFMYFVCLTWPGKMRFFLIYRFLLT